MKNDKVSGGATIVGAGSIALCAGTFGLGCGLQVSILIHAGAFLIFDPFPPLDDPLRFDDDFGQTPRCDTADANAIVDFDSFSVEGGEKIRSMFHELAVLTQRTREAGQCLNRSLTAVKMNNRDAACRQLFLLNHAIPVIAYLQGTVAELMRAVAEYIDCETPFERRQFSKADALNIMRYWRVQKYGGTGLPLAEKRIVDACRLSEVERFSTFNVMDAGNSDPLLSADARWTTSDALRYYATILDGKIINLNPEFVGQGKLIEETAPGSGLTDPIGRFPISESDLFAGKAH